MKILFLASSDDAPGRLGPGESAMEVAASIIERELGEPVETVLRSPWPSAGLPDLVDRWLAQHEPDVVVLKVNSFWFNYLSVPLLVERKLGPLGKRLNAVGIKAGENPWLNNRAAFRAARKGLVHLVGGARYFTTDEVLASMQECSRRILAREGVALLIEGPMSRLNHELPRKMRKAHEGRRQAVHQGMKRYCASVHVPFIGQERLPTKAEIAATVGADRLHLGAEASRKRGEEEAAAVIAMWREMHGEGAA